MNSRKRQAYDCSGSAKQPQAILMETKVAIIKQLDSGECCPYIQYGSFYTATVD